ncbi:hypothetical protein [Spirosoma radiotolerans]|uniref:hypothetical protein n=1 Tax=Spirosoma radiotolerans TaxID=1379870 RepID=UPI000A86B857|nr:hypothetical protein [Spirosoma radiotolerans]
MTTFSEVNELNIQEANEVNGGDYTQGYHAGSAVRNLITEVGAAVGGFVSGLFGY